MPDWTALYLPSLPEGDQDPTKSGFRTQEAALEYVLGHMCKHCQASRERAQSGTGTEFDSEYPSCFREWSIVETDKLMS